MYEIEKYVAAKWEDKEFKKKLSKDKSRSLTTLRQKLKKYLAAEPKINAEFEEYKKAPDASDAETGDEEADDKDSEDEDSEESLSSSEDEEACFWLECCNVGINICHPFLGLQEQLLPINLVPCECVCSWDSGRSWS